MKGEVAGIIVGTESDAWNGYIDVVINLTLSCHDFRTCLMSVGLYLGLS